MVSPQPAGLFTFLIFIQMPSNASINYLEWPAMCYAISSGGMSMSVWNTLGSSRRFWIIVSSSWSCRRYELTQHRTMGRRPLSNGISCDLRWLNWRRSLCTHLILLSLRETRCLPSAQPFAECIFSCTRQIRSLPSVIQKTLGKINTHGKQFFAECIIFQHSANMRVCRVFFLHSANSSLPSVLFLALGKTIIFMLVNSKIANEV